MRNLPLEPLKVGAVVVTSARECTRLASAPRRCDRRPTPAKAPRLAWRGSRCLRHRPTEGSICLVDKRPQLVVRAATAREHSGQGQLHLHELHEGGQPASDTDRKAARVKVQRPACRSDSQPPVSFVREGRGFVCRAQHSGLPQHRGRAQPHSGSCT